MKSPLFNNKALEYEHRLTAAQAEIRLMLLGSPPDMVHDTTLHRVCVHIQELYLSIINDFP